MSATSRSGDDDGLGRRRRHLANDHDQSRRWHDAIDTTGKVQLERSASVEVDFCAAPDDDLEFTLETPTVPVEQRPDLGIGADDVRVKEAGSCR